MQRLKWNDTDFLDFFSVEPTGEDHWFYNYQIERHGLELLFTLWEFDSVIQASLFRGKSETAVFTFAAYVRGEARFINDERGRYIDFEDCIVAPNPFVNQDGDPFDRQRFQISVTIRLVIDPDIRIDFVDYT